MRNLNPLLTNTQFVNYHIAFTMYPLRISKMFSLYKDLYIGMQRQHCYRNSQKDHSCVHCNPDLCDDIQSSFLLAHDVTNQMFQLINSLGLQKKTINWDIKRQRKSTSNHDILCLHFNANSCNIYLRWNLLLNRRKFLNNQIQPI